MVLRTAWSLYPLWVLLKIVGIFQTRDARTVKYPHSTIFAVLSMCQWEEGFSKYGYTKDITEFKGLAAERSRS